MDTTDEDSENEGATRGHDHASQLSYIQEKWQSIPQPLTAASSSMESEYLAVSASKGSTICPGTCEKCIYPNQTALTPSGHEGDLADLVKYLHEGCFGSRCLTCAL